MKKSRSRSLLPWFVAGILVALGIAVIAIFQFYPELPVRLFHIRGKLTALYTFDQKNMLAVERIDHKGGNAKGIKFSAWRYTALEIENGRQLGLFTAPLETICYGIWHSTLWCSAPNRGPHGRDPLSGTITIDADELLAKKPDLKARLLFNQNDAALDPARGRFLAHADDGLWYELDLSTHAVTSLESYSNSSHALSATTTIFDEGNRPVRLLGDERRHIDWHDSQSTSSFLLGEFVMDDATGGVIRFGEAGAAIITHYERLDANRAASGLIFSLVELSGKEIWAFRCEQGQASSDRLTIKMARLLPQGLVLVYGGDEQTSLIMLDPKDGRLLWRHEL
jgi:hypothetical protein